MIPTKISEITQYLQTLTRKEFQQYLIATLTSVTVLTFGTMYYFHHTTSTLIETVKNLNTQSNKAALIIAQHQNLEEKENLIREELDKHPEFTMNSYFERFYTKHNLTPEPNWRPEEGAIIEGTQEGIKYQEIILQATFKNQTMQKLVTILQDIYREPIIYLKGLEITKAKSKIDFELTLASKQYLKEIEEE